MPRKTINATQTEATPEAQVEATPEVQTEVEPAPTITKVEHVTYVVTDAQVPEGINTAMANARMSERLSSGQWIIHIDSSPFIQNLTNEEIGTRVFVIFGIPG